MGRSGTTVLERSLGTDDRVVSLGEVTHLWERSLLQDELCGCELPFSQCPFWQEVGNEVRWLVDDQPLSLLALKRRVDRSLRTPQLALLLGNPAWRAQVAEYGDYYVQIYQAAAQIHSADVVIDSSKQASLPWVLMHRPDLDLKVLHCVRDSRAVAYSWTKVVARPEARGNSPDIMHRYSPGMLSLKWMQHNIVVEALQLQRVRTLRLRYEGLGRRSRGHASGRCEFAGDDRRPVCRTRSAMIGSSSRSPTPAVATRCDSPWAG